MANEKEYEILVNATPEIVTTEEVTYQQIVDLAYPNHPNDAKVLFLVTFEGAKSKPREGTLGEGGVVTVHKKHTIFDVTPSNRS